MKEQSIAELKVVPLGTATPGLSQYVAAVIDALNKEKGITFQLTAMGTIIQGPLERLFEVARRLHEVPFSLGAQRVSTTLSIDDRRDKVGSIEAKVRSVESKLQK